MAGQEWWDPLQEKKGGPMQVISESGIETGKDKDKDKRRTQRQDHLHTLQKLVQCRRYHHQKSNRVDRFDIDSFDKVEVPQLDVLLKRDPYLTEHQVIFCSVRSS